MASVRPACPGLHLFPRVAFIPHSPSKPCAHPPWPLSKLTSPALVPAATGSLHLLLALPSPPLHSSLCQSTYFLDLSLDISEGSSLPDPSKNKSMVFVHSYSAAKLSEQCFFFFLIFVYVITLPICFPNYTKLHEGSHLFTGSPSTYCISGHMRATPKALSTYMRASPCSSFLNNRCFSFRVVRKLLTPE